MQHHASHPASSLGVRFLTPALWIISATLSVCAFPAIAQPRDEHASPSPADIDRISDEDGGTRVSRTRIFLGPALGPAYPGADRMAWRPHFDFSRAREGEYLPFEAADESPGFNVYEKKGRALGLAAHLVGPRKAKDVDHLLPGVKRSLELGFSGQSWLTSDIRLRAEVRKAISGHKGWVGNISADYVAQQGDDWLFSIGPRLMAGDARFHRAYYAIRPEDTAATDFSAYRPKGGLHSLGLAASYGQQLNRHWGITAYAAYERLIRDAAASPVTRHFGSRHQPSAGIALSYIFHHKR